MRGSLLALHPSPPFSPGQWPVLKAIIEGEIEKFHTPDTRNAERFINSCLGLAGIRASWRWRNCNPTRAVRLLDAAIQLRHEIARGVNPRPAIDNRYSAWLPDFIRRLARCTDGAVRDHLIASFGLSDPRPA